MPELTPDHVAQLRRFLPAREGDPVKIPRILLDADNPLLCRELAAMGLLSTHKRSRGGTAYCLTDDGIEAAG